MNLPEKWAQSTAIQMDAKNRHASFDINNGIAGNIFKTKRYILKKSVKRNMLTHTARCPT